MGLKSDDEVREVASHMRHTRVAQDEIVIEFGDQCEVLFIVIDGICDVLKPHALKGLEWR